jgi:hypothetical protein
MKSPVRTVGWKQTPINKRRRAKRIGEAYDLWPLKIIFYIWKGSFA